MAEPSIKLGKIFIGGLSYETTDDKLRSYFSAFGPVTDAVVMKDPISRRSRGFGFITYADPICVDRALAQPNHILDGRRVEAKRAVPRAESTTRDSISSTGSSRNGSIISSTSVSSNAGTTKKIFVGGLHYETKDAEFRRYFQQFGKVMSAEVMFNRETNKSRGFGFVIFEHENSVELVLQDHTHVIDGKSVEVKRAVPRTDVPPPRSVSSRAGSFSGTAGPGSVGSLDDVSVTSTASISRAGTPSSSLSASAVSVGDRYSGSAGNGSTLSGYAAAVRYGGRGIQRNNSMHQPSPIHDMASLDNPEHTLARVADRLTNLVLEDDHVSSAFSTTSSSRSSHKILDSPVAPLLSPLGITPRSLNAPMTDQWNMSPARVTHDRPQLSPASQAGGPWQTRPWQKGWASQAEREDRFAGRGSSSQDPLGNSYFSAFAGDHRRGSGTSMSQSTWSPSRYSSSSAEFGELGAGSGSFGGESSLGGDHGLGGGNPVFAANGNGTIGNGSGISLAPRSPYSSLGGFLAPTEFFSQNEPEMPFDSPLGGTGDDFSDEKLEMRLEQQYS